VCLCVCKISQISQKKAHDLFVFKCCCVGFRRNSSVWMEVLE